MVTPRENILRKRHRSEQHPMVATIHKYYVKIGDVGGFGCRVRRGLDCWREEVLSRVALRLHVRVAQRNHIDLHFGAGWMEGAN